LLSSSGVIDPNQTSNDNGSTADPRSNNEFYYADVTGAGAGDYLAILGNTSNTDKGDQVTLGGVTFDTVATTPEPSTYALMLGGLGMLALVARLRRKA
jgi:proteasome assembly chaperone (PAC2) family protein